MTPQLPNTLPPSQPSNSWEKGEYVLSDGDTATINSCMTPALSYDRADYRPRVPPGSILGGFGFPQLSSFWTTERKDIVIVQSLDFSVIKDGSTFHLKLPLIPCPTSLIDYMTEKEWIQFRGKVNDLGRNIRWNTTRSLIIVVVLFAMVVVLNLGSDGLGFSLGDEQIGALIVLAVIGAKLIFDEWRENREREKYFNEMNLTCQTYSDAFRSKGVCIAFRCAETGDHGLVTDLVFYKVGAPKADDFLTVP